MRIESSLPLFHTGLGPIRREALLLLVLFDRIPASVCSFPLFPQTFSIVLIAQPPAPTCAPTGHGIAGVVNHAVPKSFQDLPQAAGDPRNDPNITLTNLLLHPAAYPATEKALDDKFL